MSIRKLQPPHRPILNMADMSIDVIDMDTVG